MSASASAERGSGDEQAQRVGRGGGEAERPSGALCDLCGLMNRLLSVCEGDEHVMKREREGERGRDSECEDGGDIAAVAVTAGPYSTWKITSSTT